VAIPAGLYGRNMVASCLIKVASGSATHKLQVYDGSNVVAEDDITSSADRFVRTSIHLSAPSSGNLSIRLEAQANEPEIFIDDCYLGDSDGYKLQNVSQAALIGTASWVGVVSCTWDTTSTTLVSMGADTDCNNPSVTGDALAPTTKLPAIRFPSLQPGKYKVTAVFSGANSAGITDTTFALSDGTTTGPGIAMNNANANVTSITHVFEYAAPQGAIHFEIFASAQSNTAQIRAASANANMYMLVERFPLAEEQAVNFDTAAWKVDATVSPTSSNITLSGVDQTSAIDVNQRNLSLNINSSQGSVGDVEIPCLSGTAPEGTTCNTSAVNEGLGISFTPPRAGNYEVCASLGIAMDDSYIQFFLAETGLTNTTIAQPSALERSYGYARDETSVQTASSALICQTFNFDDVSKRVVRMFYTLDVFSGGSAPIIVSDIGASHFDDGGVRFTVRPLDQQFPAPVINNSVTSNGDGPFRIEYAQSDAQCTSDPCTIDAQSGSWLTGVERNNAGNYDLEIASGIFSAAPTCTFTNSRGNAVWVSFDESTATSTFMNFFSYNSGGTLTDIGFSVMCMGPR
jgi:hypothetical protein